MSPWTRGLTMFAIFLATTVVFLWPALSGLDTYGATDLLLSHSPYREFHAERFKAGNTLQSDQTIQTALVAEFWEAARSGELQLWESDQAGGLPLFTGVHNRVLAPFHLAFLVVPLALGTTASMFLGILLCQVGTYLLARRVGLGWGGSVFAAVAYTFSGPVVAFHLRVIETFVLPWLLWAIHGALFPAWGLQGRAVAVMSAAKEGWVAPTDVPMADAELKRAAARRGWFLVGVAAATAATWFSGFPAAGFFNLYHGIAFALVLGWVASRGRGGVRRLVGWAGATLPVGLALVAGTLVAAVQLLPTYGFLGAGSREPFPLDHAAGLAQLATAVSGRFYGTFQFRDWWSPFVNFANPVEASSTAGLVTLALLVVVVLGRRGASRGSPHEASPGPAGVPTPSNVARPPGGAPSADWLLGRFFLPSGLLVLLAVYLGGAALAVVHVLPFMATNSFGRARYLLALAVALAAGRGLDLLTRRGAPDAPRVRQRPGIVVRVQVAVILLAVALGIALGFDAALPIGRLGDAGRALLLPGAVLAAGLVAMAVLRRAPGVLAVVLILLVAVELQWGGWRFTPASASEVFYPDTPALDAIEDDTGQGGMWRFLALERTTLLPHAAAFLDVDDARAEYPVFGPFADLFRAADPGLPQDQTKVVLVPSFTRRLDPGSPILDAMSVRYLTVALTGRLLATGEPVTLAVAEARTPTEFDLPLPPRGIRGVRLDLRLADPDCRQGWVELAIGGVATRRLVHDVPRERPLTFPLPDAQADGGAGSPATVDGRLQTTGCEVVVRGTTEVVPPAPDTTLRLVSTTGWSVYERGTARPRVELASGVRRIDDPEERLAFLAGRAPDGPVVVDGDATVPAEPARGTTRLVGDGEDRVEIEVDAEGESLLVLRDVDAPGWEARIDRRRVPVVRVDHAFRGVVVPPGRSTVVFKYAPVALALGVIASLAGLALAGALGVWGRRTGRPRGGAG